MTADWQARIDVARHIDVGQIIGERGIKLTGRSPELCGPCPQCGGKDRFSINFKKQVFNCRGCGAKGGGSVDLVMFLDGCDFSGAIEALTGCRPVKQPQRQPAKAIERPAKSEDKRPLARWLWERRLPITEGCAVDVYLRGARGYEGPIPSTLGYLAQNGEHPPAMIAAFGFCEEPEPGVIAAPVDVTGVHITRLTRYGRKADCEPVKIMVGAMSGLPIVLAPVNDGLGLAITEGIEDGLSVFEETGLGVWAAGSAGNMPKIAAALPPYVECTTIFAHRDETGLRFAKEAARLVAAMEVEVHIKGRG
jgi:CHC2 zinc finger/Toprim domain